MADFVWLIAELDFSWNWHTQGWYVKYNRICDINKSRRNKSFVSNKATDKPGASAFQLGINQYLVVSALVGIADIRAQNWESNIAWNWLRVLFMIFYIITFYSINCHGFSWKTGDSNDLHHSFPMVTICTVTAGWRKGHSGNHGMAADFAKS